MIRHFFILTLLCCVTNSEIHRARGPPKSALGRKLSTPRSTWPPGPVAPGHNNGALPPSPADVGSAYEIDYEEDEYDDFDDKSDELIKEINIEYHSRETWIYSIGSAALVGLSGIFPLLVIPLESGEALKHGTAAARLRLLLSFAVGSLLGDVFLHLLPEAWAHLKGYDSHKRLGIWVILGLCSFLLIEKIFPEEAEEEEEGGQDEQQDELEPTNETGEIHTSVNNKNYTLLEEKINASTEHNNVDLPSEQNNLISSSNITNLIANGTLSNGVAVNKEKGPSLNGTNHHVASNIKNQKSSDSQKSHIKTTGWLNLLANVIDNFTHGLAVAGSYSVSKKVGILTTIAVLLHEIPHEVGDFAILLKSGFDRWKAAKAQLITATGGIFGAVCALLADSVKEAGDRTAWVLPFASGGFIYIALVTVVPDLMKETNHRESLKQLLLILCGIGTMALVTLLCFGPAFLSGVRKFGSKQVDANSFLT